MLKAYAYTLPYCINGEELGPGNPCYVDDMIVSARRYDYILSDTHGFGFILLIAAIVIGGVLVWVYENKKLYVSYILLSTGGACNIFSYIEYGFIQDMIKVILFNKAIIFNPADIYILIGLAIGMYALIFEINSNNENERIINSGDTK